jgi:lysophospholipase L1-like esterase
MIVLIEFLFLFFFANSSLHATELQPQPADAEISIDLIGSDTSQLLQSGNPAIVPAPNETDPLWMQRHSSKLNEIHEHPVDLLFIGDSIIQCLETNGPEPWQQFKSVWDRYYAPFNALNLGFNGDNTANVLWRLNHDEISGLKPKVVVLEIGTNNAGKMHCTPEQTLEGIDAVISLLHKNMPEAKIVILKILPCTFSCASTNSNVNDALVQYYLNSTFVLVEDFTDVFMLDGQLNRNLYTETFTPGLTEALHPSSEGQEKIAKGLRPLLQRLISGESKEPNPQ